MRPFPEGMVGTIASTGLRMSIEDLVREVASGPVGIQRWNEPVRLVLMSREDFDALWKAATASGKQE